jgi:hypothetical protein
MDTDWYGDAGVFLTRDALAEGYDEQAITKLVRQGVWHRIRRGAYVLQATWQQLDAVGRHRLTARAVLRTAHPSAALSHVSSLLEYDVPVWGLDLSEVHLTRADGRAGRREAGVVHHRGRLERSQVQWRNGLPVLPPARCALELTTMAGVESSLVSVNWMLGTGLTTTEELQSELEAFRWWPQSLRSDLVLRLADGRCAWAGEARFSYLIWREHLPKPEPQLEIRDESGQLIAIVDFALPEFGVFIEFDGRLKYEMHRRDGESLNDFVLREKRREELVCTLMGWVCIRVTWDDLARPALTARRIRAVLEGRGKRSA